MKMFVTEPSMTEAVEALLDVLGRVVGEHDEAVECCCWERV